MPAMSIISTYPRVTGKSKAFHVSAAAAGWAISIGDRIMDCLSGWRQRASERRELSGLSEQTLRDIGISRCDAASEVAKPFWQA